MGQHGARQTAAQGTQGPAHNRQGSKTQQIGYCQRFHPRHGQGENLVGIEKGNEKPGQQPDFFAHPLAQSQTHQGIAAVDNQLGQNHFPQGGRRHNYRQACKLTGAGQIGQGNQCGAPGGKTLAHRHGAKSEAHGKIAHSHRKTPVDSGPVLLKVHFCLTSFYSSVIP